MIILTSIVCFLLLILCCIEDNKTDVSIIALNELIPKTERRTVLEKTQQGIELELILDHEVNDKN